MSDNSAFPLDSLKETIGIFVIIGLSMGVTGSVILSRFDASGGIATSILLLVVSLFAYLLGPVVAMISGLRIGNKHSRELESYIIGCIGSGIGHILMIVSMIVVVSLLFGDVGIGGESAGISEVNTDNEFQIGDQIINILQMSIPSSISGIGGVFIGGDTPKHHQQNQQEKASVFKWIWLLIMILMVIFIFVGV